MQHVWIVTIATDYEGEDHIGVFASKDGAVTAALAYIDARHSYAIDYPPVQDDSEQVRWRFSDTFTLTAMLREVKP
jgi:hypothetical protein